MGTGAPRLHHKPARSSWRPGSVSGSRRRWRSRATSPAAPDGSSGSAGCWRAPGSTASSSATSHTPRGWAGYSIAGDFAGAHDLFVQAGAIGTTHRDRELVTLARIGEGRMLVYLGALAGGCRAARRGDGFGRGPGDLADRRRRRLLHGDRRLRRAVRRLPLPGLDRVVLALVRRTHRPRALPRALPAAPRPDPAAARRLVQCRRRRPPCLRAPRRADQPPHARWSPLRRG